MSQHPIQYGVKKLYRPPQRVPLGSQIVGQLIVARRSVYHWVWSCFLLVFGFVALASLAGCAGDKPTLSPLLPTATILAFGDSLTRGTGSSAGEDYPTVLAGLSGHQVINAGIPGEVSRDGLSRLGEILRTAKPALMILCHGGNDMLRKKDLSQTTENLINMIDLATKNGTEVLLVGVPKPGLLLGTASFYEEVATQTGVPAQLDIVTQVLSKPDLKADPAHPNGRGYALMAEAIFDELRRAGAL